MWSAYSLQSKSLASKGVSSGASHLGSKCGASGSPKVTVSPGFVFSSFSASFFEGIL
ncbi:MAG: hypothetical protein GKC01_00820 [Candidatus Methanofastidiosa archaeon]|nr:hypothetical protein [Candidatus Methanofastidiosa archaeon]